MSEEKKETKPQSSPNWVTRFRNSVFADKAGSVMKMAAKISSVLVCILVALLFFLLFYYKQMILSWSKEFVNQFGYVALFFLTWASDVIIQPIPADFFVFGSTFGGASMVKTALVAGSSSALGGSTGYFLGKLFGPWRFRRIFGSKVLRAGSNLFKNHGGLAIFVAGITPIPYSAVCWIGGIYNMSLSSVIINSVISRTLRYLVVGWLTLYVNANFLGQ